MPIPLQSECESILKPLEATFCDIVTGAWADWLRLTDCCPIMHPSARASIVWDRMVTRAREKFASRPDVRGVERDNSTMFVAKEQALFRFKKADDAGLSRNYPTQTALAFHDHDEQLCLTGLPDLMRVEVVYVLDEPYQTEIDDIRVVCRNGNHIAWSYSISAAASQVTELPQVSAAQYMAGDLVHARRGRQPAPTDTKKDAKEK